MLVRLNREPNATDAGGGAANAQPSTSGDVGASAGASQNAVGQSDSQVSQGGSQQPASAHNFKELGDRLNRGEILSDDEHSAFMESLTNGEYDKQAKDGKADDGDDSNSAANPDKNGQNEENKDKKQDDPDYDPLFEAMQLTGAKEAKDLPGLIKGLRDSMNASGGKLGDQVKSLTQAVETQHSIFLGLANGDPAAFAEFQRVTGKQFPGAHAANVQSDQAKASDQIDELGALIGELEQSIMTEEQVNDSLDPEATRRSNNALKAQLRLAKINHEKLNSISKIHEENLAKATNERAREAVYGDLISLAATYADDYNGVSAADVRKYIGLFETNDVVHPKIAPLVETLRYAVDNNMSFDAAHKVLHFDKKTNHNHIVKQALAEQRNKLLNQQPPNSISQRNNGGDVVVTMEEVQGWLNGNGRIPDQYMGENGLDMSKLPKNIQKQIGL